VWVIDFSKFSTKKKAKAPIWAYKPTVNVVLLQSHELLRGIRYIHVEIQKIFNSGEMNVDTRLLIEYPTSRM
jgi:hypothetical protein